MTTTADHIVGVLRPIAPERKFKANEIPLINQLAALWDARTPAQVEPAWTVAARSKLGEKEVPGKKHNPWIISFWKQTPWLKTDDSDGPWCGGFMKWSLEQAGLPYPKEFPRASSFKAWGVPVKAQVGAIGVKARKGGNHVFQIVGETADKRYYKALGGNQNDGVSIIDILKTDVDPGNIRWPEGVPPMNIPLPVMPRGTIGASEA